MSSDFAEEPFSPTPELLEEHWLMPPSGFNERAIKGLLEFVEGCYDDLLKKIDATPGLEVRAAIEEELAEIRAALESFSLEETKLLMARHRKR
jgi:hypothetical protein